MLEVKIYNDIANKDAQVFMSLFGMDDCVFSAELVRNLLNDNPTEKDIKFNIHCNGGEVSEGLAIYDILRTSGRNLYMNIEGGCHSMAIVLLLAAPKENRSGNANLRAVIHRVRGTVSGGYTADEFEDFSNKLRKEENAILDIYEERTGTDRKTLEALLESEKERTATELLQYGFISKINSYNTNYKQKGMSKSLITNLLNRLDGVRDSVNSLLNGEAQKYDYKDSEGNILFSIEAEEDNLEVGNSVTIPDGGSEGKFTISNNRIVTIEGGEVTKIEERGVSEEELENLRIENLQLRGENEKFRTALEEYQTLTKELKNQIQSDYTPPGRVSSPKTNNGDQRNSVEIKNEAKEKIKKMKGV